jgi:hypothetical protein
LCGGFILKRIVIGYWSAIPIFIEKLIHQTSFYWCLKICLLSFLLWGWIKLIFTHWY